MRPQVQAYLFLERLMIEADEREDEATGYVMCDALDTVWSSLTKEEREALNKRNQATVRERCPVDIEAAFHKFPEGMINVDVEEFARKCAQEDFDLEQAGGEWKGPSDWKPEFEKSFSPDLKNRFIVVYNQHKGQLFAQKFPSP